MNSTPESPKPILSIKNENEIEINNNVKLEDLYNGKEWIHGTPLSIKNTKIRITVFLITICSSQLEYSLKAINKMNVDIPFKVSVIMNVSPTNKAYNEMRLRCTTDFFIQNDEDMEMFPDAMTTFMAYINDTKHSEKHKIFLHGFRLIDTVLGIGNPPTIYCLKLYNNSVMKHYPTYQDGKETVSSIDNLWHKPVENAGYKYFDTKKIIAYHGKHRTPFDLFLRYCKITSSILDKKIKTNAGHLTKLLRPIFSNEFSVNVNSQTMMVMSHFLLMGYSLHTLLPGIKLLNSYVPDSSLSAYGIKHRVDIDIDESIAEEESYCNVFIESYTALDATYVQSVLALAGVFTVLSGNYEYSFDKYPYELYDHFMHMMKVFNLDAENIDDVLVVNSDSSNEKPHFDKKEKKIHINESSYDMICESM